MSRRVWISWEHHRRSKELAPAFECDYVVIDRSSSSRLLRYLCSIYDTSALLLGKRWSTVFVQCPSLVLAVLAGFLKNFRSFVYVIDAHNALPNYGRSSSRLLRGLAAYAVRKADFVIVTNAELQRSIEKFGGRALVLPDKLPNIPRRPAPPILEGAAAPVIVLVCSFAWDEPIADILAGLAELRQPHTVFVTGRKSKAGKLLQMESPQIRFTDYLPEAQFEALIQHADLIIDITVDERILVCGAYEAVAVGVPSLLADFPVARSLFARGSVFAKNTPRAYAQAVESFLQHSRRLTSEMQAFKPQFEANWAIMFSAVSDAVAQAEPA